MSPSPLDLTGQRFGRLVAVRVMPSSGEKRRWECVCNCGDSKIVNAGDLRSGKTESCGCIKRETRRPARVIGDTVEIPLTNGKFAVVDLTDADLGKLNWHATNSKRSKTTYAWMSRQTNKEQKAVWLHRVIAERMGLDIEGKDVDHVDCDGLNCRRSNLRAATKTENQWNVRKPRTNTSGYKGVTWNKEYQKWVAQIRHNGRTVRLGTFIDPAVAAAAYEEAARRFRGEFARTA